MKAGRNKKNCKILTVPLLTFGNPQIINRLERINQKDLNLIKMKTLRTFDGETG
jgi:hypothetical protein